MLTGEELLDHISREKVLTEEQAARIMKDLLLALAYCHSKNIIHGNIRPQNLIYESKDANAPLKLIDFAMAQPFKTGEKSNAKVGSLLFAAPEVLRRSYNEKCDVWSCGIILYLLLSGRYPFHETSNAKLLQLILKGTHSKLSIIWCRSSDHLLES